MATKKTSKKVVEETKEEVNIEPEIDTEPGKTIELLEVEEPIIKKLEKTYPDMNELIHTICYGDLFKYLSTHSEFTLAELLEHYKNLGYNIIKI